ncbi:MAG: energy transducer TonB [Leptospiraceae bacterium]|nr:energy transducer TonB [Leptospiraceae bacterium]
MYARLHRMWPVLRIMLERYFWPVYVVLFLLVALALYADIYSQQNRAHQTPATIQLTWQSFGELRFQKKPTSFNPGAADSRSEANGSDGSEGEVDPSLVSEYFASILRRVDQFKRYPRRERDLRREGVAIVRVQVDSSGNLLGAQLIQASPESGFNTEALRGIRSAAPFAPFPVGIQRDQLTFDVRVRFTL